MASKGDVTRQTTREQTIGSFLLRRLREIGMRHLFGVAGDFNLEFLDQVEEADGLEWIGCCNELNASYAADGYARTFGVAALVTTYGVGELSSLCGVAGSYAEHLAVIHIAGAPPLDRIKQHAIMHHTMGDGQYGNMLAAALPFSVAQTRIEPSNAVSEIDRCLRACLLQQRPIYLQLPSDVAYTTIAAPVAPFSVAISSDQGMLQDFSHAASMKIQAAGTIAILVDADVARFGQAAKVLQLAQRLGAPVAVMGTAKAVIDETSPNYLGIYSGAYSKPQVREAIEGAECLLLFGVRFADSTTGSFSQIVIQDRTITIDAWRAAVHPENFEGIAMQDAIEELLQSVEPRATANIDARGPESSYTSCAEDSPIRQSWFWQRLQAFLQAGDIITAENGTSLSGITGTPMPTGVTVLSQALWGSIGYSLPACFGSMIAAPERRHLLFIGDGSFQLTAQELSSILRHNLKPIIFLINNDGYTIERLILGETASYNDIQPWKYSSLCSVFAGDTPFESCRVSSTRQLEDALTRTADADCCFFIEVVMPRMDAPQALKTLGPVYAKQDYGKSWERRSTVQADG